MFGIGKSPSNASGDKSSNFYFVQKSATEGGNERQFSEIESVPAGTSEDEFAPRVLPPQANPSPYIKGRKTAPKLTAAAPANGSSSNSIGGFFGGLFSGGKAKEPAYGQIGTLMKLRKAPIKIEPKVFFANERTFLAWMHLSVILAGASIAILAVADDSEGQIGQLYGIVLLPVAIAFIVYSMYQYQRRANMIRNRHPGPYEDTVGPTVLCVMLMISILAQFSLKMYSIATQTM
ncbi:hypothetical protein FisN_2Lh439 [Fistulifera solaris]|uniref:DUF202 domain-containing protein n=1 Tax=Fistulifera solaris TaxID=1519565 RepID=A0A1Z5JP88_FISSO|nr:hypothetical protein FisN_2Lh439 [Fistulifera solaris]|eukprot:GAX15840.1 hypothetical protein FisN_2Lh439 [Fistulifera solaris]